MARVMGKDHIKVKGLVGIYYRESTERTHRGRPDRRYWFSYRDSRGKFRWEAVGWASEGITPQYANQKRIERLNLMRLGENPGIKKVLPSLDEVAEQFFEIDDIEGRHVKQERNRYQKHLAPYFGKDDLTAISDTGLTRHKGLLLKTLSPASVKLVFALLRRMINFALRKRMWTGTNPVSIQSDFKMPKVENKGEKELTPEQCRLLLDALEKRSPQLRDMAMLSLRTAMRSTELFDLKGKDLRPDTGSVFIEAKGGKRYEIQLAPDLIEMLMHYQKGPEDHLFTSRNGGRLNAIPKTFNRTVLALGLMDGTEDNRNRVWFHVLRHTCISRWARSGKFNMRQLMEAARHQTVQMTVRYAHLFPQETQGIIAAADRAYLDTIQP